MTNFSRRELLQLGLAAGCSAFASNPAVWGVTRKREVLPVAAVVTEYTPNSHADVIVGKILTGYRQDGGRGPDLKLVSLYADQFPAKDLSRKLAEQHGFRIARSIDEALTHGTNQIQVAGVLSIGEHGQYALTADTKQQMYPRRRFFDDIVATFQRVGKTIPVFNDKHLGYRWDDALFMVETARAMQFALLAGSSLPVAWRLPVLDLPIDCEIESALAIGYGGLEAYGFHAIEALQCMLERRKGSETGVTRVQAVSGDEIRHAESDGRWSQELFAAVLKTFPGSPNDSNSWTQNENSAGYLLNHQDGLKSAVLMANGLVGQFGVAVKLKSRADPLATWFKLQEGVPYAHFGYLVRAFEHTLHTGYAAYPVERTLLTTGILDRLMQSLAQEGKQIETPELNVTYRPVDWPFANHPDQTLILPYE